MVAKGGSRISLSFLVVPMVAAVRLTVIVISRLNQSPWLPGCLRPIVVSFPVCRTASDVDHQWAVTQHQHLVSLAPFKYKCHHTVSYPDPVFM